MQFDRAKTLLELTREKFQDPAWDFFPFASGYHLRHVPVKNLRNSELWTLAHQSIGLDFLMVIALDRLEMDPLVKCKHREGDLLSAVLCADALVWKRHPEYRDRVTQIWKKVAAKIASAKHPQTLMLFADYRWFLKSKHFLP